MNTNHVLKVGTPNLKPIVELLLLRFADAGLIGYFDRMADYVLEMIELRSERLLHQAQAMMSDDPPASAVQHSQWTDCLWLWIAYISGNAMAMVVFVVCELSARKCFVL